ncbi:MAG: cobalamin-binding protein [Burkholderiales bacterium]|nr:cobalamin-binding protein [Burkholderiales bacterium]
MRLAAALAALALVTPAHGEVRVVDDRGVAVTLAAPAQRIVTLAPSLAELAFAAGAGDRVIGVSTYTDYPKAAARLPVVGSHGRVDVERIVAMRPDLVLAWQSGNPARDIARLERLGVPVFVTEPRRLEDIPRILRAIGALAGVPGSAESAAAAFAAEARRLGAPPGARPVRVFVEIWHDPLLTVTDAHLIGDLVARCGGENVFATAPLLAPQVAREQLLARDPEVIVSSAGTGDRAEALALWRDMPSLRAVREGRVHAVDARLIHRQGPRILQAMAAVCASLAAERAARP